MEFWDKLISKHVASNFTNKKCTPWGQCCNQVTIVIYSLSQIHCVHAYTQCKGYQSNILCYGLTYKLIIKIHFTLLKIFWLLKTLIFVVQEEPFSLSISAFRVFHSRVGFLATGLTHKHYTIQQRPAMDKHSNILIPFINYGRKRFYNIWS
jgi:hypothetical protein